MIIRHERWIHYLVLFQNLQKHLTVCTLDIYCVIYSTAVAVGMVMLVSLLVQIEISQQLTGSMSRGARGHVLQRTNLAEFADPPTFISTMGLMIISRYQ